MNYHEFTIKPSRSLTSYITPTQYLSLSHTLTHTLFFPLSPPQSRLHRYSANNQKLCWSAVTAIETGNITALASLMTDAQVQCAFMIYLFNYLIIESLMYHVMNCLIIHIIVLYFNYCSI